MNPRISFLLFGLAVTLVAAFVYPTSAAESEPNNTRVQANSLLFNSNGQAAVTGRISPLSDLDFFSITTPSFAGQATLVITMTPTSADHGLDARVQLQNSSGTLLADRDVGFDNDPETLTFTQALGGTTYFIVCRSADFSDAGSGDYTLQVDLPKPNLAPFQPAGWFDKIVVSKSAGNSTDSTGLTSTNILYLDWAILNSGNASTTNRFYTDLYVDGVFITSWFSDPPLSPSFYINVQDYAIGPLSVGTHAVRIITDSTGAVSEINESDNDYTKTITVLDDDPNDQISGALDLGAVNRTITMPGAIDSPADVDMFSFIVVAGQRLSFDIDQTSGLDSYIRLFNTNGVELAANDDAPGAGEVSSLDSYLEYTFTNGGTYYLGVSGFNNTNYNAVTGTGDVGGSSGSYTLVVSPGLAGFIRRPSDTTDYLVDILRFGTNPLAINPNQRTWIVIHGWMSSRTHDNISDLASSLFQARPGDQILTLDWSAAAETLDGFAAESSILPVARWAAAALTNYGFRGTNLNVIGHSFGSYVADEIAQRISGGVYSIVALDPAENVFGGYDPEDPNEVNFARDSEFSWAFHSSTLGSGESPVTADEAFVVTGGPLTAIEAHSTVVFLFAYMIAHPTDFVGQYFLLSRLLELAPGPWVPNQFFTQFFLETRTGGYEADIVASGDGHSPLAIDFVVLPSIFISGAGTNVTILWKSTYTNFVLQSSTTVGQHGSWTNVSTQPLIVGQSNVVSVPHSESMRFFRLKSL